MAKTPNEVPKVTLSRKQKFLNNVLDNKQVENPKVIKTPKSQVVAVKAIKPLINTRLKLARSLGKIHGEWG